VEECLLSRNYVCVTLDADEERNLTSYLLKAYGLHESQLPVVAYVNPKNGHVHLLASGDTKKSIKTWLEYINKKMIKPSVILPEKTWAQRPLMYDYLELTTHTAKSDQSMQKDQADSGWKKNGRAQPWGTRDLDQHGDEETYECPMKKMAEEMKRKEDEKMKMDMDMEMQKEKATCTKNKQKMAMASKEVLQEKMAEDAHECPMKKMAEEMKRKQEQMDKRGLMRLEKDEEMTINMMEDDKMTKSGQEPVISASTRKITKEILEEEEKKAQKRVMARDEDGRDEL